MIINCVYFFIVKLLLNFYNWEKGDITIQQNNIRDISLEYLGEKIAYISQDIFLFLGTIYENLTLGMENPDMEEVIHIVSLQYQLDNLNSKNSMIQQKAEQKIQLAKYKFQAEYYNAGLYYAQQTSEKANYQYLKKSAAVEKEKLALGETTQIAVDLLKNKLQLSETKIQSLDFSIDASKQAMLVLLEEYDLSPYSLNTDFDFSGAYLPDCSHTATQIQEQFCGNNLSLQELNYTIQNKKKQSDQLFTLFGTGDTAYKTAAAELEKSKVQKEISEESYKSSILKRYTACTTAASSYTVLLGRRELLKKSLKILNQNYLVGEISEL